MEVVMSGGVGDGGEGAEERSMYLNQKEVCNRLTRRHMSL